MPQKDMQGQIIISIPEKGKGVPTVEFIGEVPPKFINSLNSRLKREYQKYRYNTGKKRRKEREKELKKSKEAKARKEELIKKRIASLPKIPVVKEEPKVVEEAIAIVRKEKADEQRPDQRDAERSGSSPDVENSSGE